MFELPKSNEDLGYIIGGSALSVLLFLLAPTFPLLFMGLANFMILPLLCLGLGRSLSAQFYASLLTVLLITVFTSVQAGLIFSFVSVIPAILLAYLALLSRGDVKGELFWYPLGRLIAVLSGYTLGLSILFFLFFLNSDYKTVLRTHLLQMAPDKLQVQYSQLADQIIRFLPAIMSISALLVTLINGIAAQMILVKLNKNQRPTPAVSTIELSWWLWIALALCGLAAFLLKGEGGQFFMNAVLVLLFAFLFEGLGIVHLLFAHYLLGKMFLWIFYISMIVFGWPILIVIAFGLFEPWIKLRERFTP